MNQNSAITTIKGIGEKTKDSFAKMGLYTVGDILLHFPRTYVKYPKAEAIDEISFLSEEPHAIVAKVMQTPLVKNTRRMQVTLLTIGSSGHKIQLVWYRMPYIRNTLTYGHYFVFYGKVTVREGKYTMEHPVIYTPENYQKIQECFLPVYSISEGVTNNLMIKTIRQILDEEILLTEYLPKEVRQTHELCEYN